MNKVLIPPVFFFVSIGLMIGFHHWLPGLNWIGYPANLLGIVLIAPGILAMGMARGLFARHRTSLTFKKPTFLVRDGIYRWTRNPIYAGMTLILLGLGICMRNVASMGVSLGFFAVIHFYIVAKEEQMMEEAFGEEYLQYKREVRRWV